MRTQSPSSTSRELKIAFQFKLISETASIISQYNPVIQHIIYEYEKLLDDATNGEGHYGWAGRWFPMIGLKACVVVCDSRYRGLNVSC
jgi:hypothetical protein